MRINCKGEVQWTTTLGVVDTASGRGAGYDLALLNSTAGLPLGVVVVGDESYTDNSINPPITRIRGHITRVNLDGGVAWDRFLDRSNNSAGIRLRAVDLLRTNNGIDVVVAGSTSVGTGWSSDRRAFFYRMHTWNFTGCGAYLGQSGATNDDFMGIDAMTNGRIGLVGTTQSGAATTRRVLLGLVNADSCLINNHRHWSAGGEGISGEDIVETLGTSGQSTGLAITGTLTDQFSVSSAHISAVNAATLMPLAAPAPQRFGTNHPQNERLRALDTYGPRLLAAGTREEPSLFDGANLYLVATSPVFTTTCEVPLVVTAPLTNYFNEVYSDTPQLGPSGDPAVPTAGNPDTVNGFCCAPTPG
jgi:hypothetical protein